MKLAMYSIELRRYIDSFSQYQFPRPSIKEKIDIGTPHLFDFDYPFFDETKRKDFERKWVRRFYMTEVGFETIELFKFYLENWMNEKMPYYNQMFKSELLEFDPLRNFEIDKKKDHSKDGTSRLDTNEDGKFETHTANDNETHVVGTGSMTSDGTVDSNGTTKLDETGTKKGNNKNESTGNNFARTLESDTPDKRIAITTEDGQGVIEYASKINEVTGKNNDTENITIDENTTKNSNGNTTDNTTTHDEANTKSATDSESHDVGKATGTNNATGFKDGKTHENGNQNEHQIGKYGTETYSEMLMKYRETFLRIESEIYEECRKDLFMLVY